MQEVRSKQRPVDPNAPKPKPDRFSVFPEAIVNHLRDYVLGCKRCGRKRKAVP